MALDDLNVKDVERRLTNIVKSLMPKFLSEAKDAAKETAKIAKDLAKFGGTAANNFLGNFMGNVRGQGNQMAGAAQVGSSLAKPGVGLMEFVTAAEGYASGMSTFMPSVPATLQRASTYYNASLTMGPRQSRLGVQQATFGILNQMGAITSLGSDADVANILGSQGMSINRGVYGQTVTAVGNAARYLNMSNEKAASAISGLTTGRGASNMLRNFGIYTSDLMTGKEKTQGQIFEELAQRLTAGRPNATVEETLDSIRRGNLGETIANSGLTEDQQTLFKQFMVNRAAGKKMDLSDQDAMKSIMEDAKTGGNENPLTGMMNLETAATGALGKAEGAYVGGINAATVALVELQKASGGLAALLGGANAFMKTLLSDNTVQGMSTMVKSSLDLISSGMKAVESTTVMGSNPQMAVAGGAATVTGGVMLGGVAAQLAVGRAAGGTGPTDGDNAMSTLTSAISGASTQLPSGNSSGNSEVGAPISTGSVLTEYGKPAYDNLGHIVKTKHDGIDYKDKEGTVIKAVADGIVTDLRKDAKKWPAGWGSNSYGNFVKIQHEDKTDGGKSKTQHTVYAHLKDVFVKKGQKIKKGDPVGTLGQTGQAYSPHLHFEYLVDGKASNPKNFKKYTDATVAAAAQTTPGMDSNSLAQASSMATALQGLFSGNMSQMTSGLSSLAGALGIDVSKYAALSGSTGGGQPSTSSGKSTGGNTVTNNTTINVTIPQATPDEAKKFAELVAQYHDQNTLTSSMGRF